MLAAEITHLCVISWSFSSSDAEWSGKIGTRPDFDFEEPPLDLLDLLDFLVSSSERKTRLGNDDSLLGNELLGNGSSSTTL